MSRGCRHSVCRWGGGGWAAKQQHERRLLEGWIRVFSGKKKWCKEMTNSAWEVSLSLIIRPRATSAKGCHKVTFFYNPLCPAEECQSFPLTLSFLINGLSSVLVQRDVAWWKTSQLKGLLLFFHLVLSLKDFVFLNGCENHWNPLKPETGFQKYKT